MKISAQNEPLTEAELDRLQQFLQNCRGGKAMNIEELSGFFAALDPGPPSALEDHPPRRRSAITKCRRKWSALIESLECTKHASHAVRRNLKARIL